MIKSDFVWSQNCSFRIDEHIIAQISIKAATHVQKIHIQTTGNTINGHFIFLH